MNQRFVSLLFLMACGGDGGGNGGLVDVEDPSSFCRAAAQVGCETMYSCLTDAERKAKGLPMTIAECEREIESGCEDAVDSCDSSTTGYASSAAGACLQEMDAATCNDAGEPWLDAPSCNKLCAVTAGAFQIKWAFDPPTWTCSQVGVETVAMYSVGAGGKTWVDTFDCYSASGITDALPVGSYAVHIELFDSSNTKRWVSSTMSSKLDDDLVSLGTVIIPVAQ